jgi:hypothetical protein
MKIKVNLNIYYLLKAYDLKKFDTVENYNEHLKNGKFKISD